MDESSSASLLGSTKMRHLFIRCLVGAVLVLLTSCTSTSPSLPSTVSDSEQLREIADAAWKQQVERDLGYRIRHGLPIHTLPEESMRAAEDDAAFAREVLRGLSTIDPALLDPSEQTTRSILLWHMQQIAEAPQHYWLQFRVTPYASAFRVVHQVFPTRQLATPEHAATYLDLLEDYADWIDELTAVTSEQERRGIVLPKAEIEIVLATLNSFIQPVERSLFFVSDDRASSLEESEEFQKQVRLRIERDIVPALEGLVTLLDRDAYRARAPEQIGLSQYPGGRGAYERMVRYHTTLPLSPEDLHERGLQEIARIQSELDGVQQELGFEGTREEFFTLLSTDPRLFAGTPDEVRQRLQNEVRRIEPHIDELFGVSPNAPYDVRRLDPRLEGAMTFGYYQPPSDSEPIGTYFFNGSKLDERSLLFATPLMLHELVPGHHFQISMQFENDNLHPIRRENSQTAFVEGWGEYAATLGREMGLYEDPWDRAGRLMMDMLLSTRLVVDTGMNALGWTRDEAIDFMKRNTLMSEAEIGTETLRYAVDIPGQALAYKTGSMKLVELRETARERLGTDFDLRAFHDMVLLGGSMPLSVLEERVMKWIDGQKM